MKKAGWTDAAIKAGLAGGLGEGGWKESWKQSSAMYHGQREESYGPYQFFKGGELPGYLRWAQENGVQEPTKDVAAMTRYFIKRTSEMTHGRFGQSTDVGAARASIRGTWHGATSVSLDEVERTFQSAMSGVSGDGPAPGSGSSGSTGDQAGHASPAGTPGAVVDQMVKMSGTRGAAVREFLRDPNGVMRRDPNLGLWCAAFTNSYLQHAGVQGTGNQMARSFASWGYHVGLNAIKKGDVLLNLNREHVGVATGRTWLNTPGHSPGEVEEISSNTWVPGKGLVNLPSTRWRSDVEGRRNAELERAQMAEQEKREKEKGTGKEKEAQPGGTRYDDPSAPENQSGWRKWVFGDPFGFGTKKPEPEHGDVAKSMDKLGEIITSIATYVMPSVANAAEKAKQQHEEYAAASEFVKSQKFEGTPLSEQHWGRPVEPKHTVHITVHGAKDANETAKKVEDLQEKQAALWTRYARAVVA